MRAAVICEPRCAPRTRLRRVGGGAAVAASASVATPAAPRPAPLAPQLRRAPSLVTAPRAPRAARVRRQAAPRADAGAEYGGSASAAPLVWSVATVVDNKPASADGSLRTLVLSVQDEARRVARRSRNCFLLSRSCALRCADAAPARCAAVAAAGADASRQRASPGTRLACLRDARPLIARCTPNPPCVLQERARWADAFTRPGQYVALRAAGAPPLPAGCERKAALKASRLVSIASTPYATHRDSAFLDAAIIEILVDHTPDFALKARRSRFGQRLSILLLTMWRAAALATGRGRGRGAPGGLGARHAAAGALAPRGFPCSLCL